MDDSKMPRMNIAHRPCFHDETVQISKSAESYKIPYELKHSCDPSYKEPTINDLGGFLFGGRAERQCSYHIIITEYKQAVCKRQDCLQSLIAKRIIHRCNCVKPFSIRAELEFLKEKVSTWTIMNLSECIHPVQALTIKENTYRDTKPTSTNNHHSQEQEQEQENESLPADENKNPKPENGKRKELSTEAWLWAKANCGLCYKEVLTKNRCTYKYETDGSAKQVWDGWILDSEK